MMSIEKWLEEEKKLIKDYGESIIFSIHQFYSDKKEWKQSGIEVLTTNEIGGDVPVYQVIELIKERRGVLKGSEVIFVFGNTLMIPTSNFYSSHYMMLPAFIDVYGIKKDVHCHKLLDFKLILN